MFSEARRHAALVREFYEAYIAAGFDHAEAFELTKILIDGLMKMPPQ
jgi:hypothetical protein